ncbi:MAG: cytochrome b [Alphaproteobacteria bacterium]|nr:cytochrome b [Alphaproteobacteria bacterium]
MTSTDAAASYTKTAKALHWLIAALILFMLALGYSFDFFPKGAARDAAFNLHKSIGITILLLSLARLGWRFAHRAPPFPATMPMWEQRAAHAGHVLLYVFMIGMPLTGWAMVSAAAHPLTLFGTVSWPLLPVPQSRAMAETFVNIHNTAAFLLILLLVGHVAAAMHHHFGARDDILLRMLPRRAAGVWNRMRGQG